MARSAFVGSIAATALGGVLRERGAELPQPAVIPKPQAPRRYLGGSRLYTPNGDRECGRRARQIAAGSLRAENGLRLPATLLP
jgi:hypothetical protein